MSQDSESAAAGTLAIVVAVCAVAAGIEKNSVHISEKASVIFEKFVQLFWFEFLAPLLLGILGLAAIAVAAFGIWRGLVMFRHYYKTHLIVVREDYYSLQVELADANEQIAVLESTLRQMRSQRDQLEDEVEKLTVQIKEIKAPASTVVDSALQNLFGGLE